MARLVGAGEEQLSPKSASCCPLCQERVSSLKEYARHVGRHQKELALFALPKLDAGKDADDATAERATDSSEESEEGILLLFASLPLMLEC